MCNSSRTSLILSWVKGLEWVVGMISRFVGRTATFVFGSIRLFIFKLLNFNSFIYHTDDMVSPFSYISLLHGKVVLGKKCRIDSGTVISAINGLIRFGDGCFVNRNCQVVAHQKIILGNNVIIGPNVIIMDHDHAIEKGSVSKHDYVTKEIKIEDNVWIGANSVILKGVTIGKGAVIAAGSVVTHDCPAGSVLVQKRTTETKKVGE